MAGEYNDAPGARMGWDADGSILLSASVNTGTFTVGQSPGAPWAEASLANRQNVNNEDASDDWALSGNDFLAALIFPELRDIDGVFFASPTLQTGGSDFSVDTTNAIDGAWTTMSYVGFDWDLDEEYRDNIDGQSLTGVRCVRFFNSATSIDLSAMHIYGSIASGETPDRIIFLDEASGLEFGQSTAPEIMDFGDRPRGSIIDHEFRLRNNSTVAGNNLTATTIVLTREALEGVMDTWMTYDEAGGGFMTSETVTSLAPETNSGLLTLRLDVDPAAQLFVWAARTKVAVTTWA